MRDESGTFPHSHCQECQSRSDSLAGLGISSIRRFGKLEACLESGTFTESSDIFEVSIVA